MSFFEFVSLSGSTTDGVPNPLLLREASFKKKKMEILIEFLNYPQNFCLF